MNQLDLKQKLVGYELRCDICNKFMPFNEQTIQAHYDEMHAGQKSNWREHTDFTQIATFIESGQRSTFAQNGVQNMTIADIENDQELSFMSPDLIAKARSFADILGARLYKFTSLADGHAHKILDLGNGKVVNFDYFISLDERKRAARSMYDQDINLNHYLYSPYFNFVVDAEDVNGKLVALVLIEDPLYNQLYDSGLVTGNSVEYYRRNSACRCNGSCTCNDTGVIYVGWALVSAPATPADPTGEVIARNFVEVAPGEHTRMLAQVQASVKAKLTNSYQRASEKDGKIDNTSVDQNLEDSRPSTANNCACHSAQPGNTHGASRESDVNTTSPQNEVQNNMINEKEFAELVSSVKALSESVNKNKTDFDNKIGDLVKQVETFTKAQPASQSANATIDSAKLTESIKTMVNEALTPYKADMIEFGKKFDTINEMLTTGKGISRQPTTLTAEDYKAVLPAKIADMSLAEIAEATS